MAPGVALQQEKAAAAEAAKVAQRKFRQMLVEHEVDEFSRWEKACKKFDGDPRYVSITINHPQTALFVSLQGRTARQGSFPCAAMYSCSRAGDLAAQKP